MMDDICFYLCVSFENVIVFLNSGGITGLPRGHKCWRILLGRFMKNGSFSYRLAALM